MGIIRLSTVVKKFFRHWRIIYGICCIAYMGFVIFAGRNEFDRINSQYHHLVVRLEPERIRTGALEELAAECRKTLKERAEAMTDSCSAWSPAAVEIKEKEVRERRLRARERGLVKVVLFYSGLTVIFLLGPLITLYCIIAGIIAFFKNVKIVS